MPAKKKKNALSIKWRKASFIVLPLLALFFIYIYAINSLPMASNAESTSFLGIDSGATVLENAAFAPQKIAQYALFKLGASEVFYFRLISTFIVLASVGLFYWVIKEWISRRIAVLTTILFASSTLVIYTARWSGPEAMLLFALPALLLGGTLLKIKEYDPLLPLTTAMILVALFIPGFWTFVLIGLIIIRDDLLEAWKEAGSKIRSIWIALMVIMLAPLAYLLSKPASFADWIGVPENGLNISTFLGNLKELPGQLFMNGTSDITSWLYGTPIIDIVATTFFVVGLVYVIRDARYPIRRLALTVTMLLCLVLIGMYGQTYISLVLPLIYIFAGFGIAYILEQWFHIFPKNPMARSFGLALITVLVLSVSSYHVLRYHYVWPRSHDISVHKGSQS